MCNYYLSSYSGCVASVVQFIVCLPDYICVYYQAEQRPVSFPIIFVFREKVPKNIRENFWDFLNLFLVIFEVIFWNVIKKHSKFMGFGKSASGRLFSANGRFRVWVVTYTYLMCIDLKNYSSYTYVVYIYIIRNTSIGIISNQIWTLNTWLYDIGIS